MLKNVILSLVILAIIISGGFYFFSEKKIDTKVDINSEQTDTNKQLSDDLNDKPSGIEKNMITLETNYGKIVFETYNTDAPNTVENFINLANKKFYDGLTFHRVIKGFMIQGGDPNGNGTGGPGYKFNDEINPNSEVYKIGYKKGVVAMANSGPNTNGSQFFIMTEDYPLPSSYTVFGRVVSGQDVVDTIANVKTGANDKPASPVVINKVSVQ